MVTCRCFGAAGMSAFGLEDSDSGHPVICFLTPLMWAAPWHRIRSEAWQELIWWALQACHGGSMDDIEQRLLHGGKVVIRLISNRDLAESLKDSSVFAFKIHVLIIYMSKKGIYKMELLQLGINIMWFTNQHDEGVIHHKYLNPMPIKVIALVLTTIECCIDKWLQGVDTLTISSSSWISDMAFKDAI
ncbi:hypothetical protein BDR07DRAFT_1382006 [Suillus spraguei]|nr:hypothetical protein BDR07DRAFT_1382006 [Suillus spraguei]